MRVQLFNPPVYYYSNVHYALNPPLGLPILAAVLENAGHTAEVADLEMLLVSPIKLAEHFRRQGDRWPDVVGFTCLSQNVRGVRESIAALRSVGYQGYIMVGGPHITLFPEQGLEMGADVAVVGECEGNIVSIIEAQPKSAIVHGERMPIEDIPAPLWEKHQPAPNRYGGNLPQLAMPEGITMWSRGCPGACTFCSNPVFRRQRIRRRPKEAIREELLAMKQWRVHGLFVYDDELVAPGNEEWLTGVCGCIADLGYEWKCQGRVSRKHVTPELMREMHSAGCRAIMWGVESFSDDALRNMNKGTAEEDIWHSLRCAKDAGIGNWLFLMVGNYKETVQDLAHTERQLKKAREEGLVQWRQVTICTPTPGSDLHQLAKDEGWYREPPEDGPRMAQVYAPTPWLSEHEMKLWKRRLDVA